MIFSILIILTELAILLAVIHQKLRSIIEKLGRGAALTFVSPHFSYFCR